MSTHWNDLQEWYVAECNGDWEHQYGVTIETLDNPGWTLKVDLVDTALEGVGFEAVRDERTEHDWIFCSVKDNVFRASGGPRNLDEMVALFVQWSRTSAAHLRPPE